MPYIVAILTAAAGAAVSYVTLNKNITDRVRILKPRTESDTSGAKELQHRTVLLWTAVLAVLTLAAALRITTKLSDWINICKMLSALVGLCGVACVDYREHRIPNIFPLDMAVIGIVLLAVGYFSGQFGAVSYITSSVFATVVSVLCLTGASALTNHGIGFGDIKTIGALALIGGVYTIYGTLFFSILLCACTAVFLLAAKKKKLRESLPYGPFILAGYMITIFISKY